MSHVFYSDGAFRPSILPSFIPHRGNLVVTRLPLAHHPFLSLDFPFLTCLERKTSFDAGGDKIVVFCLTSVGEAGRKILFRSVLFNLCFSSSFRSLRAMGLLGATVMQVYRWGCCDEVFSSIINYCLFPQSLPGEPEISYTEYEPR
jgi:hypothetical protein